MPAWFPAVGAVGVPLKGRRDNLMIGRRGIGSWDSGRLSENGVEQGWWTYGWIGRRDEVVPGKSPFTMTFLA